MDFSFAITNTAAAISTAVTVFLLGGMYLANKKK